MFPQRGQEARRHTRHTEIRFWDTDDGQARDSRDPNFFPRTMSAKLRSLFQLLPFCAVSKEYQYFVPNVNTNIIRKNNKSGCRTHGNCRVSFGGRQPVHGRSLARFPKQSGSFSFLSRVRAVIMRYVESGTEPTYTTDGSASLGRDHPPLSLGTSHVALPLWR